MNKWFSWTKKAKRKDVRTRKSWNVCSHTGSKHTHTHAFTIQWHAWFHIGSMQWHRHACRNTRFSWSYWHDTLYMHTWLSYLHACIRYMDLCISRVCHTKQPLHAILGILCILILNMQSDMDNKHVSHTNRIFRPWSIDPGWWGNLSVNFVIV